MPLQGQRIKADFLENNAGNLLISDTGQFEVYAQFPKKDQYNVQVGFSPLKPVLIGFGFFDKNTRNEISSRPFSQGYSHSINARSFRSEIGFYHVIQNSGLKKNALNRAISRVHTYQYQRGLIFNFKLGVALNSIHNLYELESGSLSETQFRYTDYDIQTGFYMRGKQAIIGVSVGYKIRRYHEALVHNPINNALAIERFLFALEEAPALNALTLGVNFQLGVKQVRFFGGVIANTWNETHLSHLVFEDVMMQAGIILEMNSLYTFFNRKNKNQ